MGNAEKTVARNLTTWVHNLASNEEDSQDTAHFRSAAPLNILVYPVTRWGSSVKLNRLSSLFSGRRSVAERTGFSCKQWLLVLFEMLLSFCWWVIRTRRTAVDDLNKSGITERQELIDLYMRRGIGSFISLFVGYFADTYVDMYKMALVNVALHFLLSTVLLMEITIHFEDYDLYNEFVFETVGILLIPLKATDFARNVFALQIIGRKNLKTTLLYLFFAVWFSDRALGGVMVFVVSVANTAWGNRVRLSFLFSLIAMSSYLHVLKPQQGKFVVSLGRVGNDFIGCIVTALWTKYQLKDQAPENLNWLDYAEIKYDRVLIVRARDLLKLCCLILSTIGFSLYMVPRCDFYEPLLKNLIPTGSFALTGIRAGAKFVTIITMGVTQLVIIPLLEKLGWKRSFLKTFILGYLLALFCMGYVALLLTSIEDKTMPGPGVGKVRILNVRTDHVTVASLDPDIVPFNQVVRPKGQVVLSMDVSETMLIRVHMTFSDTNFTSLISAEPDSMVGYVLFEPANLERMGRDLPVRELRAGKNEPMLSKLYVYNALEMNVTVEFRNSRLGIFPFKVTSGQLVDDQVPPGKYDIRTLEFESNGAKTITMDTGGFYGILAHESDLETLLSSDTLVVQARIDSRVLLGVQIPYGLAVTLGYVTLRGMVFINTPEGMEGMSFGFLVFVDSVVNWVIWIGHEKWHPFITSFALSIYLVVEVLLMFSCVAVFVKFKGWYKFK